MSHLTIIDISIIDNRYGQRVPAGRPFRRGFDAGFSVTGWLAVLLTFLLARVFAEGTLMRDDLEGTV